MPMRRYVFVIFFLSSFDDEKILKCNNDDDSFFIRLHKYKRTMRYLSLFWTVFSAVETSGFLLPANSQPRQVRRFASHIVTMSAQQTTSVSSSWADLQAKAAETVVGKALNAEVERRKEGRGSAHVQNSLRLFDSKEEPQITLYRDHAGW